MRWYQSPLLIDKGFLGMMQCVVCIVNRDSLPPPGTLGECENRFENTNFLVMDRAIMEVVVYRILKYLESYSEKQPHNPSYD
mmetsp:Transcript_11091/g.26645  ORF Transcript_11091/g.26645 Transcript_11091/m.26645 type:complete len:82 (+) Transcript_11091:1087-1332(+)